MRRQQLCNVSLGLSRTLAAQASLVVFCLLLSFHSATAHSPSLSRDVRVQVNSDGSSVVWLRAHLGRSERVGFLEMTWDSNHDGALDFAESRRGSLLMAQQLVATLRLQADGEPALCAAEHHAKFDQHELWLDVLLTCEPAVCGSVVIEDGLGGRMDATAASNAFVAPIQQGEVPWLRRAEWCTWDRRD